MHGSDAGDPSSGDDSDGSGPKKTRIYDDMNMIACKSVETIQEELGIDRDELNQMRVVRIRTGRSSKASGLYATFKSGKHTYTGILSNQHVFDSELCAQLSSVAFMNKEGYEVVVPCNVVDQGGFYFTGKDSNKADSEAAKAKALARAKTRHYQQVMGEDLHRVEQREIDQVWRDMREDELQSNEARFNSWWAVQEKLLSHGRDWAFVGLDLTEEVSLYNGKAVSKHTASLALKVLGISPYDLNGLALESVVPDMGFEGVNDSDPVTPGEKMTVFHYAGEDYRQRRLYNKYERLDTTLTYPKRPEDIERAELEAEAQMAAAAKQGGIKVNTTEELTTHVAEGTDVCFKGESGTIIQNFEGSDTTFGFKATGEGHGEDKAEEPITEQNILDGLVTLDVAPEPTNVGPKKGSGDSVSSGDEPKEPEDPFHKAPRKVDEQTACVSQRIRAGDEHTFIITGYELTTEQKEEYLRNTCGYFAPSKFASTTAEPFEYNVRDAATRVVGDTNLAPGASGAPYFREGQFVAIHVNGQWNNCTMTGYGGEVQHHGDLKVSGAVTAVWVRNALAIEVHALENPKSGGVEVHDLGPCRVGMRFNVPQAGTDFDHEERVAVAKYKKDRLDEQKEAKKRQAKRQAEDRGDLTYKDDDESSYWTAADAKRFNDTFDDIAAKDAVRNRTKLGGTKVYTDAERKRRAIAAVTTCMSSMSITAEPVKPAEDPAARQARDDDRERRLAAFQLAQSKLAAQTAPVDAPAAVAVAPKRDEPQIAAGSFDDQLKAARAQKLAAQKLAKGDDSFGGAYGTGSLSKTSAFAPQPRSTKQGLQISGFSSDMSIGLQQHTSKGFGKDVLGAFDRTARPAGGDASALFDGEGKSTGGNMTRDDKDSYVKPTTTGQTLRPTQDPTVRVASHLLDKTATDQLVDQYYITDDKRYVDAYMAQRMTQMARDLDLGLAADQTPADSKQAVQAQAPAPQPPQQPQRRAAPTAAGDSREEMRRKRMAAMGLDIDGKPLPKP